MAEFELAEAPGADFAERLAACLPEHMGLLELRPYEGRRSLAARVNGVSYEVDLRATEGTPDAYANLLQACARFAESLSLCVPERREDETRHVDVRQYVETVEVADRGDGSLRLSFEAKVSPKGTARPERVVEALSTIAGTPLTVDRIVRTQVHLGEEM
jgi:hypothetical protein